MTTINSIYSQRMLKDIFCAADRITTDVSRFGTHLTLAARCFDIPVLQISKNGIKGIYGQQKEKLITDSCKNKRTVSIKWNIDFLDYFMQGNRVLIYNIEKRIFEFNTIKDTKDNVVMLAKGLQNDYPEGSKIVVIKEVEYKFIRKQKLLKRRENRGTFIPFTKNVTGFDLKLLPEFGSLHYRIEIDKKEQLRGYIHLTAMSKKEKNKGLLPKTGYEKYKPEKLT